MTTRRTAHHRTILAASLTCLCMASSGCSDEQSGSGSLRFYISGEGPARDGYPFTKDGFELVFDEGWSIQFHHMVASVGRLRVATTDGEVAYDGQDTYLAELTTGDPVVLDLDDLTARRWDALDVQVVPAQDDAVLVNDVDAAIAETMRFDGLTYYYEGTAERDGMSFDFRFGLANPTRNTSCTNGNDDTQGVVVQNGSVTETELTIHLDHMFWDTLGSQQFLMRFDAMAAADDAAVGGDGDHVITLDELAAQRLSDLKGLDGAPLVDASGAAIVYDPGTTPLSEPTLRGFVLASTATQLHINGLGFCTIEAL